MLSPMMKRAQSAKPMSRSLKATLQAPLKAETQAGGATDARAVGVTSSSARGRSDPPGRSDAPDDPYGGAVIPPQSQAPGALRASQGLRSACGLLSGKGTQS